MTLWVNRLRTKTSVSEMISNSISSQQQQCHANDVKKNGNSEHKLMCKPNKSKNYNIGVKDNFQHQQDEILGNACSKRKASVSNSNFQKENTGNSVPTENVVDAANRNGEKSNCVPEISKNIKSKYEAIKKNVNHLTSKHHDSFVNPSWIKVSFEGLKDKQCQSVNKQITGVTERSLETKTIVNINNPKHTKRICNYDGSNSDNINSEITVIARMDTEDWVQIDPIKNSSVCLMKFHESMEKPIRDFKINQDTIEILNVTEDSVEDGDEEDSVTVVEMEILSSEYFDKCVNLQSSDAFVCHDTETCCETLRKTPEPLDSAKMDSHSGNNNCNETKDSQNCLFLRHSCLKTQIDLQYIKKKFKAKSSITLRRRSAKIYKRRNIKKKLSLLKFRPMQREFPVTKKTSNLMNCQSSDIESSASTASIDELDIQGTAQSCVSTCSDGSDVPVKLVIKTLNTNVSDGLIQDNSMNASGSISPKTHLDTEEFTNSHLIVNQNTSNVCKNSMLADDNSVEKTNCADLMEQPAKHCACNEDDGSLLVHAETCSVVNYKTCSNTSFPDYNLSPVSEIGCSTVDISHALSVNWVNPVCPESPAITKVDNPKSESRLSVWCNKGASKGTVGKRKSKRIAKILQNQLKDVQTDITPSQSLEEAVEDHTMMNSQKISKNSKENGDPPVDVVINDSCATNKSLNASQDCDVQTRTTNLTTVDVNVESTSILTNRLSKPDELKSPQGKSDVPAYSKLYETERMVTRSQSKIITSSSTLKCKRCICCTNSPVVPQSKSKKRICIQWVNSPKSSKKNIELVSEPVLAGQRCAVCDPSLQTTTEDAKQVTETNGNEIISGSTFHNGEATERTPITEEMPIVLEKQTSGLDENGVCTESIASLSHGKANIRGNATSERDVNEETEIIRFSELDDSLNQTPSSVATIQEPKLMSRKHVLFQKNKKSVEQNSKKCKKSFVIPTRARIFIHRKYKKSSKRSFGKGKQIKLFANMKAVAPKCDIKEGYTSKIGTVHQNCIDSDFQATSSAEEKRENNNNDILLEMDKNNEFQNAISCTLGSNTFAPSSFESLNNINTRTGSTITEVFNRMGENDMSTNPKTDPNNGDRNLFPEWPWRVNDVNISDECSEHSMQLGNEQVIDELVALRVEKSSKCQVSSYSMMDDDIDILMEQIKEQSLEEAIPSTELDQTSASFSQSMNSDDISCDVTDCNASCSTAWYSSSHVEP